ncbi:hypothetical protein ACFC0C_31890 [Streptomyces sp. NPDC056178]
MPREHVPAAGDGQTLSVTPNLPADIPGRDLIRLAKNHGGASSATAAS